MANLQSLYAMISPQMIVLVLQTIVTLGVIVFGGLLAIRFSGVFIDRLFTLPSEGTTYLDTRRAKTLGALIRSLARYIIYFIVGTMVLQELGIETATIIATAGIGGLAIGFGAQNLVKDVLTGFFILLEDHFGVGDFITAGGQSGVVEEMGLRVTKLRDFGGQLHIIPNGSINQVTNHMGQSMRVLVNVAIAYEEDVDVATKILDGLFAQLSEELPDLLEGPKVLGVSQLADSGVELLIWAKAKTMTQWSMERELRRRVKKAFDEAGIEIPYPRRYLIMAGQGEIEKPR